MHIARSCRLRPVLATVALALGGAASLVLPASAQSDAGAGQPPAYAPPTVTKSMGDLGGKLFGQAPDPAKTKRYYIAAEPELWNYVPLGLDPVCGKTFPTQLLLTRVGWKIRYVQYADADFSARVLPTERLGILGPALRGTTGGYLAVTFLNRAWRPLSMHPHGVRYDKDNEGTYYKDGSGLGAAVGPGARFTYVWQLDEASGPLPGEPSSRAWLYHSHVSGDDEINLGLIGSIIVTDPARARVDGTPKDVDREEEALFLIFNEGNDAGASGDLDDGPARLTGPGGGGQSWAHLAEAAETGQRHTINGRAFGNLTGLEMNQDERVRWYMFGLDSENDLHSAHWHGARLIEDGRRRTDVVELLPASMKVADMVADPPGDWLFHCHVAEHMANGMFTRFTVHATNDAHPASRDPEVAFLGMPQSLSTLRLQPAELALDAQNPAAGQVELHGRVTVPTPFSARETALSIQVGQKSLTVRPDTSGICVTPEGTLLLKNVTSAGLVLSGVLDFEWTLKGAPWLEELRRTHVLEQDAPVTGAQLSVTMNVGNAHHTGSCEVKVADEKEN